MSERIPYRAKIGFYDSHFKNSSLSGWISEFYKSEIPTENSICLCYRMQRFSEDFFSHATLTLPQVAVVHPSYKQESCPEAIKQLAAISKGTHFYVPVFTNDNTTVNRITRAIGEFDNVDFLYDSAISRPKSSKWKDCAETLAALFRELRVPALQ